MCMHACMCVLISINALTCVFVCVFEFWGKVWKISTQISDCCGYHCLVFKPMIASCPASTPPHHTPAASPSTVYGAD